MSGEDIYKALDSGFPSLKSSTARLEQPQKQVQHSFRSANYSGSEQARRKLSSTHITVMLQV